MPKYLIFVINNEFVVPRTQKKCLALEGALSHQNQRDIDGEELFDEIKCLSQRLDCAMRPMPPKELLKYILDNYMCDLLPNLSIALRIMLTLPVSVAAGERSFSKLNLIKNYLRSSLRNI